MEELVATVVMDNVNPVVNMENNRIVGCQSAVPAITDEVDDVNPLAKDGLKCNQKPQHGVRNSNRFPNESEGCASLGRKELIFNGTQECNEACWIEERDSKWLHLEECIDAALVCQVLFAEVVLLSVGRTKCG